MAESVTSNDWYPAKRSEQRAMYANFLVKIDDHAPTFGLTGPQTARLKLICETFIEIHDWLDQLNASVSQCYKWRDDMEDGKEGETVAPPPSFEALNLPAGAFKGFVTEFRKKVGQLKEHDNYTQAIGADLKIIAVKGEETNLADVKPAFEYEPSADFKVSVTGKMQGFKTVKFSYMRKGTSTFVPIGFLTNLPGELEITPAQPGTPETGFIRARFFENNQDVGQYSDNAEITIS